MLQRWQQVARLPNYFHNNKNVSPLNVYLFFENPFSILSHPSDLTIALRWLLSKEKSNTLKKGERVK
jgi:hypothetical protein